jgi:3-phenylpropionate/trans-cinnamate dioxygenase ferredoxin reductase component
MAGGRAFDVLRKKSPTPVLLLGDEAVSPYNRPDLSKRYLLDQIDEDRLMFHARDHYGGENAAFRAATRAVGLDPDGHRIQLDNGAKLRYRQLLIATGGSPRRLAVPGAELPGIHYLRTLPDARALRDGLRKQPRVAVVGAGLVGLEIAAAARDLGLDVCVIDVCEMPFPLLGESLGREIQAVHETRGVAFHLGTTVAEFAGDGRLERVVLADGTVIVANLAVVGIGIAPTSQWLSPVLGAELANGTIPTDSFGRTSLPDVYAAGDVCRWIHPHYGELHTEHEAVAQNQGMRVAGNMAGEPKPFDMVPYAWSDQYENRLRTVGLASIESADTSRTFSGPGRAMATVYLRGDELVGAATLDWPAFMARITRALRARPGLGFDDRLLAELTGG